MEGNKNNYYYHSLSQLNQHLYRSTNKNSLRILQINIRSMGNLDKFDELKMFLARYNGTVDVLVIGETWVKEDRKHMYCINGYKSMFSCRENTQGGGLALFVRESIKYEELANEHIDGFHHLHIQLETAGKIALHAVYRPPGQDQEIYVTKLDSILAGTKSGSSCVILGDVNIPVNRKSSKPVSDYIDLLTCYNFAVTNTHVTRPASCNVLDHVVCSEDLQASVVNETIETDLSDHNFVLSTFNLQKSTRRKVLEKTIVSYGKLNEAFRVAMSTLPPGNAEEQLNYVINSYQTLKSKFTKVVSVEAKIKGYCPWMSLDLWKLLRMKDNALSNHRRNPQDSRLKAQVEYVSKLVRQEKDRAKKAYYSKTFASGSQRKMWSNLNSIIGRKQQDDDKINLLINGQQSADGPAVANAFNQFFSTIGPQLASTISSQRDINKFNTLNRVDESIFLGFATEREVAAKIMKLDTSKSQGPDNISARFVKSHQTFFATLLRDVFNDCVQFGSFPECLKTARVLPIHKGGSKTDVNNYRPISVLSVLSKILEQLLVSRLTKFFKKKDVIYSRQYGFRSGSSTLSAACDLVDDLYDALDSRKRMGVLFLDLKKAFDTIDHGVLLRKLEYYGIRGTANSLIKSFLSSRTQFVQINGVTSGPCNMTVGVPQGSNLGPLLFLIYINDLPKLKLFGKPHLFADDTALSYSCSNATETIRQMKEDMIVLQQFFAENLLSLNLSKTKYMVFHSTRLGPPSHPELIVNGSKIDKVGSFKYLGLTLDSCLQWEHHIENLKSEVSSTCGLLWRISKFIPTKQLTGIYHAFVQSKLQYMVGLWGAASKTLLLSLQLIQKRCLKAVYRKPRLHPTLQLYEEAAPSILPVLAMRELQCLTQIHNFLKNPSAHHNQSLAQPTHRYALRRPNVLLISKPNTEMGKKSFSFFAKSRYNSLPSYLKNEPSIRAFKKKLTLHIRSKLSCYIR